MVISLVKMMNLAGEVGSCEDLAIILEYVCRDTCSLAIVRSNLRLNNKTDDLIIWYRVLIVPRSNVLVGR